MAQVFFDLKPHEIEILQLWIKGASDTTWSNKPTREAMQQFATKLKYTLQKHVGWNQKLEFGDFS